MEKGYVRDCIEEKLLKDKNVLTKNQVSSIVDSVLFDWNELGDPEADFQDIVDWNVDQYLSHNTCDSLKRISNNEARKNKLEVFSYDDYPAYSKEEPSGFSLSKKDDDGWQKVTYWK